MGCNIEWGISDLQRLRGILEIRSPRLFLPSPDLSIGIFLRVIGHFWQQGQVIEGFILLLERGILQLESLAFISTCMDLHFLFSLWRHYFVLVGAFCSSSYLLSIFLAICWAFQIGIFIVAGFSILWIKKNWDVLACLSYCIWLRYVPWLSLSVICYIHT